MSNINNENAEGDFWAQGSDLDPLVMVLKNRSELCEDLKYVISVPDFCDVTFLVGQERQPVYGIRAILSTRSRLFYQMILSKENELKALKFKKKSKIQRKLQKVRNLIGVGEKAQSTNSIKKLTINIDDYDVRVFERFMRYVHCGTVAVDASTVVGMLIATREFEFPDLHAACWDFAKQCIRPDTLPSLVESATFYSQFKESRKLMQMILQFLGQTPDVIHCCPEVQKLVPLRPDEYMC